MPGFKKVVARLAIAVAGAAMLVAVSPTTASAATPRNGVCESGEVCFYYLGNRLGSVSDFTASVANYGTAQPTCYDFKSAGAGQYECIKNNVMSVWNRSSRTVRVYYNSGHAGIHDDVLPGPGRNLSSALVNNNASHKFL